MKKGVFFGLILILFMSIFFVGCPTPTTEKKPETVTVTFDAKNGTEPVKVVVEKGKTVLEPKTPISDGWTFEGWINKYGAPFDFNAIINSDENITAKWKGVANFYDGKGEILQTKTYIDGGSIYPIRGKDYEIADKNYIFLYWSTNKDATEETREIDEFDFDTDSEYDI